MRKIFLSAISLICFFTLLIMSDLLNAQERKGCYLCGMFLDVYASTRHVVIYEDDTQKETCSLACAATLYKNRTKEIKMILASDFLSHKLINTKKAFYIEGSDVPGVMSYTNRIAFENKKDALEFQKKRGGKIISFQEALDNQLKE